jgi:hypothetical protein
MRACIPALGVAVYTGVHTRMDGRCMSTALPPDTNGCGACVVVRVVMHSCGGGGGTWGFQVWWSGSDRLLWGMGMSGVAGCTQAGGLAPCVPPDNVLAHAWRHCCCCGRLCSSLTPCRELLMAAGVLYLPESLRHDSVSML